jgi:hypothetical protein
MATKKKPQTETKATSTKSKKATTKKKVAVTRVSLVATNLPGPVQQNEYVRRTVEILNDTEKQASRLSKRAGKKLGVVASDLKEELSGSVNEKVDTLFKKTKLDRVREAWNKAFDSGIKTMDEFLDSLGLVRKAAL